MYKIIFKGQVGEEFVDLTEGFQLAEDWEKGKLPARVKINGNLYESSSIKAVISGFNNPDHSDRNEENRKMSREMWQEFDEARDRKMRLSLEDRAKDTGLAKCLFAAHGTVFAEKEVVAAQEKSLKEFPNFAQAKPTHYKKLLNPIPHSRDGEAKSMAELMPLAAWNLAERVILNNIT